MVNHPGIELKRSKYRILGLVGQGQFGRVFCAVHRQSGQLVALKNLEHQRFPTHKFLRELRILLSLQHPNIVTCRALEHSRTGRYLVMDYCAGGTLRSLIEDDMRLSLPQSIKLIADILSGLEHAHDKGIVHCDIKPENILLDLQLKGWTARISDFGIARLSQEMASEPDAHHGNTGSPAYMAPERFFGQYSKASDLYAVGILMFELITGYRPFSGTPAELMSAHLNKPLKLPDSIPDPWKPILATALQKLAARRFHSAGEMLAALKQVADSEGHVDWFTTSPLEVPLLQPTQPLTASPFGFIHHEAIAQPIRLLKAVSTHTPALIPSFPSRLDVISVCSTEIGLQSLAMSGLPDLQSASPSERYTVPLSEPVYDLHICPQGCIAIAPHEIWLIRLPQSSQTPYTPSPTSLHQAQHTCLATVDPGGRWLATVSSPLANQHTLSFIPLPGSPLQVSLAHQSIPLSLTQRSSKPFRLMALNSRHLAIASKVAETTLASPSTTIEVITRRGSRCGHLTLPIPLRHIVTTSTPYQLLATDENDPHSVLLIDLKPFRVKRIGLELAPDHLLATPWGYSLVEGQKILFLDEYGQRVGAISTPEPVTAIAPLTPHGLLVATWNSHAGQLYILDLKQLGVGLMF